MSEGILIVGGYGAVGAVVAAALVPRYEEQIIIAGRNDARAAKFAASLGPRVRWRAVDMTRRHDFQAVLADVRCVVACLDVPDVEFVRQCFQQGIHYIDISADYRILSAIASLSPLASQAGATAVLSVGLVPGLSNLLARHSLRFVEPVDHFDAALLTGLGEKHGVGGSSWMLSHLGEGRGRRRFQFPTPYRHRMAYRFAFSDQWTLPTTLPIAAAATWMAFDSRFMTHLIGTARLPLLRRLFRLGAAQRLLLGTTQRWQFGSDEFVLTTCARGTTGSYQAWLRGHREVEVTGLVTAEVVRHIVQHPHSPGVFHIEQLFELEDVLPLLERHGATFRGSFGGQSQ